MMEIATVFIRTYLYWVGIVFGCASHPGTYFLLLAPRQVLHCG